MKKIIEIMNYENKKVPIELNDFDNVVKLQIEVITGDEILHVLYKDYSSKIFDSSCLLNNPRIMGFADDLYTIYDITKNINYIDNWNKRKNSYIYKLKEVKK